MARDRCGCQCIPHVIMPPAQELFRVLRTFCLYRQMSLFGMDAKTTSRLKIPSLEPKGIPTVQRRSGARYLSRTLDSLLAELPLPPEEGVGRQPFGACGGNLRFVLPPTQTVSTCLSSTASRPAFLWAGCWGARDPRIAGLRLCRYGVSCDGLP